jgi:hypothetical protein
MLVTTFSGGCKCRNWMPVSDHYDAERAVATRQALLDRLANFGTRTVGYQLGA